MNTVAAAESTVTFEYFNREALTEILPHRGSALRKIDGVFFDHLNRTSMTGFKEVQPEDPDLEGHFPDAPTYPGYAQDEFACLTAAALILHSIQGLNGNPHVVQKIVKYKKPVAPGDTLIADVKLTGRKSKFFLFTADIRNQRDEIVAEYEKIVGAL